jgi:uncharacterized OB-fold protein
MTRDDNLSDAASRILAKRLEQPKLLMLTCAACGEYHEAYYKDFCERCQAAGRPT